MNWKNNISLSFLEPKDYGKREDFINNKNEYLLASINDNSMYDTYQKDDTVRIKVTDEIPEECDCLLLKNDEVMFRHLKPGREKDTFILSLTNPETEEIINKDDLTVLGFATSILRI